MRIEPRLVALEQSKRRVSTAERGEAPSEVDGKLAEIAAAEAFIDKHAATENGPLVLRYKSVALAAIDQSDADMHDGMRG